MTEPANPPPAQPPETPWLWLQRNARLWGFGAFVVAILIYFRSVILPFVLALLVAYILAPLVRRLEGVRFGSRQAPRFVWIILVYVVLLGLIGLFFTSFVPRLSQDIKRVLHETPAMMETARREWVPSVAAWVEETFSAPEAEAEGGKKGKRGGASAGQGHGKGKGQAGRPPDAGPPPMVKIRQLPGGEMELNVGQMALEVARDVRPDLITLDLMMPNKSGTDFYRKMCKDEALAGIPVIVVSGTPGRHLAVKEPVAVFDKPINPDEFMDAVWKGLDEVPVIDEEE